MANKSTIDNDDMDFNHLSQDLQMQNYISNMQFYDYNNWEQKPKADIATYNNTNNNEEDIMYDDYFEMPDEVAINFKNEENIANMQFYDFNAWQEKPKVLASKNNDSNEDEVNIMEDDYFEIPDEIDYDFKNEVNTQNPNDQVINLMEKIENVRRLWSKRSPTQPESSSFTEFEQQAIIEYLIEMSNK